MNTSSAPIVFDRTAVRLRLERATLAGSQDFLLARATDDLGDRLQTVRRQFSAILDLGSARPLAVELVARLYPEARVVRGAPFRTTSTGLPVVLDEEQLPFRAEAFDLVVSVLTLQSVNDLPGTLAQVRRSLMPDGLFIAAVLGGQTLHELRSVMAQAEAELTGGASPRVAPFSDVRDLGHLLQRAGLALPVTDVDRVVVRYDTLFGLLRDLRAMGLTNALDARSRRYPGKGLFVRAAELYRDGFSDGDGRIRATFEIIWLSGWAPHESQQKPLRPGSARMRLATALGVAEGVLPSGCAEPQD